MACLDHAKSCQNGCAEEDDDSASGPPSGRLSRVDVGPKALHVQTETEGAESTCIATVVVVDGRVRQRVTSDAPPESSRRGLEQLISDQHDRVVDDLRHRLGVLERERDSDPGQPPAPLSRSEVLSELAEHMKVADYHGAIAVLERAQQSQPDDWLWETRLCLLRRKLARCPFVPDD